MQTAKLKYRVVTDGLEFPEGPDGACYVCNNGGFNWITEGNGYENGLYHNIGHRVVDRRGLAPRRAKTAAPAR